MDDTGIVAASPGQENNALNLEAATVDHCVMIAQAGGIKPLVALLEPEASGGDAETQRQAAVVLADMARVQAAYGATVAKEGGIPLLVDLLRTSSTIEAKAEAAGALSSLATEHAREMGEAGAIEPLVDLLKSDATAVADTSSLTRAHAQLKAAGAIAALAAGGMDNQDKVKAAGGRDAYRERRALAAAQALSTLTAEEAAKKMEKKRKKAEGEKLRCDELKLLSPLALKNRLLVQEQRALAEDRDRAAHLSGSTEREGR